ncbi:hypothetical protein B0H17DRAFT_945192, partial [Mycena rosella]
GVPAGFYRLCSQNAAMNHQPVIVAIAQHGNRDDCVYVSQLVFWLFLRLTRCLFHRQVASAAIRI